MDIDWEKFEKEIKEIRMGEKVGADINSRFGVLLNDFTKEKYPEWQQKMGPIVREMVQSHKNNPQEAAEAIILILLQMVYQLAQHDVLLEYVEKYNAKMLERFKIQDDRTSALIHVLAAKGVISAEDF